MLLTITLAWLANQILGFVMLGYPWTAYAAGWGLMLGLSSLAAAFVVRHWRQKSGPVYEPLMFAAFMLSFATYEAMLFGFALVVGGTDMFAPAIIGAIFVNDAMWLVVLAMMQLLLSHMMPRYFGEPRQIRFA